MDISEVVKELRRVSGLSQRDFAELAATSGPTVAAYERNHKEPRLSTLQRMADAVGMSVSLDISRTSAGERARQRRELRSRALAAATAHVVAHDFVRARRLGLENLRAMDRVATSVRARAHLEEWRNLLALDARAVGSALVDPSEHGHDLRQMSPFAGILSDRERDLVLAAVDNVVAELQ